MPFSLGIAGGAFSLIIDQRSGFVEGGLALDQGGQKSDTDHDHRGEGDEHSDHFGLLLLVISWVRNIDL